MARSKSYRQRKPEYMIWAQMKNRCNSPTAQSFPDYGGRGIRVCERWHSFDSFFADVGPRPSNRHSIHRINNDGDYCPSNAHWATAYEQSRARRSNHLLTHRGQTKCVTDWARELGTIPENLFFRISHGWSVSEALDTPFRKRSIPPAEVGCNTRRRMPRQRP